MNGCFSLLSTLIVGVSFAVASQLPPEEIVLGMRKARAMQLAGRDAESLAELENLLEQHPDDATVLLALLDAYAERKVPDAIERTRALIRARLTSPESLPASALVSTVRDPRLGEVEVRRAAAELERRVVEQKADPWLLRVALSGYEKLNDLPRQRELVLRLLEAEPTLRWRYDLLRLNHQLERWEEVLRDVEQLRQQPLDQAWITLYELDALERLGRHDECTAAVDRLPLDAETPEVLADQLLERAIAWLDAGHSTRARKMIARLLEAKPKDARFARLDAYLFGSLEQQVALEQRLIGAVIEEGNLESLVNDAAARMMRGDHLGALPLLERATEVAPQSVAAWYNLVVAATKLERWQLVETSASRVIELDPKHARAHMLRGQARVKSQRLDDGMQDARRALGLDASLKQAWFVLYLGAKLKRDEAAATEYLQNSK